MNDLILKHAFTDRGGHTVFDVHTVGHEDSPIGQVRVKGTLWTKEALIAENIELREEVARLEGVEKELREQNVNLNLLRQKQMEFMEQKIARVEMVFHDTEKARLLITLSPGEEALLQRFKQALKEKANENG
jgi:hypothetical protein